MNIKGDNFRTTERFFFSDEDFRDFMEVFHRTLVAAVQGKSRL
jgi:hypothetical protein